MAGHTALACRCGLLDIAQSAAASEIGCCTHLRLENSEALTNDFVFMGSIHGQTAGGATETQSQYEYRL